MRKREIALPKYHRLLALSGLSKVNCYDVGTAHFPRFFFNADQGKALEEKSRRNHFQLNWKINLQQKSLNETQHVFFNYDASVVWQTLHVSFCTHTLHSLIKERPLACVTSCFRSSLFVTVVRSATKYDLWRYHGDAPPHLALPLRAELYDPWCHPWRH